MRLGANGDDSGQRNTITIGLEFVQVFTTFYGETYDRGLWDLGHIGIRCSVQSIGDAVLPRLSVHPCHPDVYCNTESNIHAYIHACYRVNFMHLAADDNYSSIETIDGVPVML